MHLYLYLCALWHDSICADMLFNNAPYMCILQTTYNDVYVRIYNICMQVYTLYMCCLIIYMVICDVHDIYILGQQYIHACIYCSHAYT